MKRHAFSIAVCCCLTFHSVQAATVIDLTVDARDLPRRLLHSSSTIAAEPSQELALWYPKWIPGIHAPGGPIQNVAGIRVFGVGKKPIEWRRDDEKPRRILAQVPSGTKEVRLELDYIASQPSVNSRGVDSFGNSLVGIISWNTVLMYPEGLSNEDLKVQLKLRLPKGWRYGTSLPTKDETDGWIRFHPTSLRELIDSPLICGKHFRSIELTDDEPWPVHLHLTSESMSAIQIDDKSIGRYRRLVREAAQMFGRAPFDEYHFLVVCSDEINGIGLEHLKSSLNAIDERDLIESDKRKLRPAYLLPHEFVHAWCGKYRRPAGMATQDYHSPKHTKLLWIYEGLTQYLGEVLTVRAGLLENDKYDQRLAAKLSWHMRQVGREWRSLEDTAVASHTLRARSPSWSLLRRGQDYYNEGLLLWMEADAIIRHQSDGQRSLDDFCRTFFGRQSDGEATLPFDLDEVVEVLDGLAKQDWRDFIRQRVHVRRESLPLEVIERVGYRLQYANTPSDYLKRREKEWKQIDTGDSIGASFNEDGEVRAVVPGRPADKAGLAPGMKVVGVNDRKFSLQRIREAVADSPVQREIRLLVLNGDQFQDFHVDYDGGPKHLELVRDESRPDVLAEILKSRADD